MAFENDVFISYAHEENTPVPPEIQGWVDQFESALTAYLGRTAGDAPRIWRDPRLERVGDLDDNIREALRASAMLVCILSRAYLRSDYCRSELREFLDAFGDPNRVVKVVTATLPDEKEHPPPLDKALGYPFYKFDERQKAAYELDPVEDRGTYRRLLYDIARDIATRLSAIAGAPEKPKSGTVFLARASYDLNEQREALRSELEHHNFRVVPDRPLAPLAADCETQVRAWLGDCRIAVHLIGNHRGGAPDGSRDESYLELQARETAAYARDHANFTRLFWLPTDLAPPDDDQQQFVARVRDDPATYDHGDLVQGSFEEFKASVLRQVLKNAEAPKPAAPARPGRVYLIYAPADEDAVAPVDALLGKSGFEVRLSVFEGDEESRRRDREQALAEADWAMVYWGAGTEIWFNAEVSALRAREEALPAAVAVAAPASHRKERCVGQPRPELVVSLLGGFSEAALRPFIDAVRGYRRASAG